MKKLSRKWRNIVVKVKVISDRTFEDKRILNLKVGKFDVTVSSNIPSEEAIKRFGEVFTKKALDGDFDYQHI